MLLPVGRGCGDDSPPIGADRRVCARKELLAGEKVLTAPILQRLPRDARATDVKDVKEQGCRPRSLGHGFGRRAEPSA